MLASTFDYDGRCIYYKVYGCRLFSEMIFPDLSRFSDNFLKVS